MNAVQTTLARSTAARALVASLDEAGRPLVPAQQLRPVLTVAMILDAEAAGLLTLATDGRRTVLRATGLATEDELLGAVVAGADGRTVRSAVNRLALYTWSGNTVELRVRLLERLVADGIVEPGETRRGARTTYRVDPQVRASVVDPLVALLSDDGGTEVADPALRRLAASLSVSSMLVRRVTRSGKGVAPASSVLRRRIAEVRAADPVALIAHRALRGFTGAAAA